MEAGGGALCEAPRLAVTVDELIRWCAVVRLSFRPVRACRAVTRSRSCERCQCCPHRAKRNLLRSPRTACPIARSPCLSPFSPHNPPPTHPTPTPITQDQLDPSTPADLLKAAVSYASFIAMRLVNKRQTEAGVWQDKVRACVWGGWGTGGGGHGVGGGGRGHGEGTMRLRFSVLGWLARAAGVMRLAN